MNAHSRAAQEIIKIPLNQSGHAREKTVEGKKKRTFLQSLRIKSE